MKKSIIKSSKEIILLLLYCKGIKNKLFEPIKGRTRLMKMVFLFKEELKKPFNNGELDINHLPEFSPYDFGPFSYEVYNDIDFLKSNDFISINNLDEETILEELYEYKQWENEANINAMTESYIPEEFTITKLGTEFVNVKLLKHLTDYQLELISEFKKRCTEVSLRTLLKYVYENYPRMITKSKIRESILNNQY